MNDYRDEAARVLTFYFKSAGAVYDRDNVNEITDIVDNIINAAVEEIKEELKKSS